MYLNEELLATLPALIAICFGIRYPNVILEKPIVSCEPERMLIRVRTSASNPSRIYAEDYIDDPNCVARNLNQLSLPLAKCGMTTEKTLHPLFVTDSDRSYCAQCVYMETNVIENLQQSLSVSDSTPSNLEPKFDIFTTQPKCSYEIRRNSLDGPLIHYALLGETVFHVWKCYDKNVQILVQNCYVEDGEGHRILIVDGDGCGVDQYILPTPAYSADRRTASQEIHVFKFAEKTVTRFTCQIRVCSVQNDSCHSLAPPLRCPTVEERTAKVIESSRSTTTATASTTARTAVTPAAVKKATTQRLKSVQVKRVGPEPPMPVVNAPLATTSEADEEIFSPTNEEYESYRENNNASPPSIRPTSRNSNEAVEVDASSYKRRTRRNSSENATSIVKNDFRSLSNRDGYSSYDVSGVLTVFDSPDDVVYFESKHPSFGSQRDTVAESALVGAESRSVQCMPQIVFFMIILGVITLAATVLSVIVACFADSSPRKRSLTSCTQISGP